MRYFFLFTELRIKAWSFLRLICGRVPLASAERLAMAGRLAPSAFP
ncbi:MAG: hypothetical protein JRI30_07100 [Deltaproteobacteria bacterium]|nr:hypothetical protein [Deltaproteobacteria bacterium]